MNAGPFTNQTTLDHINTGLVQYLDGYCNLSYEHTDILCLVYHVFKSE